MKNIIPTTKRELKTSLRTCRLVFTSPVYSIFLILTMPVVLSVLLLPNDYMLIKDEVILGNIDMGTKISIIYDRLPLTGGVSYNVVTGITIYLVSITVSSNIVLLLYHLKQHGLEFQNTERGTSKPPLKILGVGLGYVLITVICSILGVKSGLASLPLDGGEFLFIAFLVSISSIHWMTKELIGGTKQKHRPDAS